MAPASSPSISTRPEVGSISRFTIFSVVVFPEPDPPEQHDQLALGHLQREAIDGGHLAVASCEVLSFDHVGMVPQSIVDFLIFDW